ncbi:Lsa25.6 family adhesin [Leptospira kanakyensis]|uniref:Lipoprotein n=1 Tax=Leptospira kanakyensis TaxID=2484968 RepID=A0A6N4Q4U5_9LEPT|nr:hypothetical protein [Leptospira kanakyensis]MCW7470121.1 hypothetical protein [Leptospira kanakyensis]TGK47878.1 hypothetical protein EHQ11_18380 [Leptospira kanakyensis]TGK63114.1 hypothetical protein EHQ16_01205 [Leptospira kanakyensis]TGK66720.1 hypothetical protein EHQ18_16440 [Leptospira kanakyensis]
MKNVITFILSCLSISCSPIQLTEVKNQAIIQWKDLGLGFFLATKEEEGLYHDLAWIYGDLKDQSKTFPLFNEWRDPKTKRPVRRLWFGPETQKLVEWTDENQNGIWETKTYFNQSAKTGILSGHIAYSDFDTDENGFMNVRIYLGTRVEELIQENGKIRIWAEGNGNLEKVDVFIRTKNLTDLGPSRQIPISESWAIHPEKVSQSKYRAVYQP